MIFLGCIDEIELVKALDLSVKENKTDLLKVEKNKPFKPFKAIKMKGEGATASQMVINDRF